MTSRSAAPRHAGFATTPDRGRRTAAAVAAWIAAALVACWVAGRTTDAAADGRLEITVVDRDTGRPIAARMPRRDARGRPRKVDKVPYWHDHFVFSGKIALTLPPGNYTFDMECGPEYLTRHGHFTIEHFADDVQQVDMKRFIDMAGQGWWSGDVDVRRNPLHVELLMAAEDLHLAEVVTWSNERNIWRGRTAPREPLVRLEGNRVYDALAGAQTWPGTEVLYFGRRAPLELPKAALLLAPSEAVAAARGADADTWIDLSRPFWWDLPVLVAIDAVDSIQVAHGHIGRDSASADEAPGRPRDRLRYPMPHGVGQYSHSIYFQLLDAGLRIPPTAGSGSGEAPNPVGYNRVYVQIDGDFTYEKWWEGLRAGRAFVTNGLLMLPSVHGRPPGHVFEAPEGSVVELEIGLTLSSRDPITYLEIIKDGQIERSIRFEEYAKTGRLPKLEFDRSGWFLIRVVTDLPKTYRFGMTAPYHVEIGGRRRISRSAAQFFVDWIYQRAAMLRDADTPPPRALLDDLRAAHAFWQGLVEQANAE